MIGYRAEFPPRCCALALLLEPDVSVLDLPEPVLLGGLSVPVCLDNVPLGLLLVLLQ